MSYWISRLQCNTCGSELNVSGGVVGTTFMGPADHDLECPNPRCGAIGYRSFTTVVWNVNFETQPQYREFTIRDNRRQ